MKIFYALFIFLLQSFAVNAAQVNADFYPSVYEGCAPLKVTFTNNSSGVQSDATYTWDLGNGNTSVLPNPGAIYTQPGKYKVTLTVTSGGKTSTQEKTISVYNNPVADFTTSTIKGCLPFDATFTSTSKPGDGSVATYYWDFGDGTTQKNYSAVQTHTYRLEQKASVSLTVINSYGCQHTVQKKDLIQIIPTLTSEFSADEPVLCNISDPIQFSNTSSGPGTLSYVWDFGDGKTSSQKEPKYSFNKKGTYTVKLTVNSSEGCSASKTQTNYLNVADFTSDFSVPALICEQSNASFVNTSVPYPTSSVWQLNGVAQQWYSGSYYNNTFTAPDDYTIKLINNFGKCKDSVSKVVSIKTKPKLGGFEAVIPQSCSVPVTVSFKDTTGAAKCDWAFDLYGNSQAVSNKSAPTYTYNTDGNYNVKLLVTNASGCTNEAYKSLTIGKAYVNISYNYSSAYNYTGNCGPFSMAFYASGDPLVNYSWNFGDGSTASTEATPMHTFSKPGSYTVTLSYTTKNGCTGQATFTGIRVLYQPDLKGFIAEQQPACTLPITYKFKDTTAGAVKWQWQFGDGYDKTSTIVNPSYTYNNSGIYYVSLGVTTADGCYSQTSKSISVQPLSVSVSSKNSTVYTGICEPYTTTFYATSNQNIKSYLWDFGDGKTSTQAEPTYSFPTSVKYYNVTLSYVTDNGCTGKVSYSNSINQPAANIGYKNSTGSAGSGNCGPFSMTLFATSTEVLQNYSWYFGDDRTTSTVAEPTHNFSNVGDWTVTLNYTTQKGCTGQTSLPIRMYDNPKVTDFTASPTTVCANAAAQFNATTTGIVKTWTWDFGDNYKGDGQKTSHSYYKDGAYDIKLTVSNGLCPDNTMEKKAYITVLVTPSTMIQDITNTCEGTRGQITATHFTQNATSLRWDFGDLESSTVSNTNTSITHTYKATGTYNVKLTAFNGQCQSSSDYTVRVLLKQNPVLAFDKTDVCLNGPINYTITGLEKSPMENNWYNSYSIDKWQSGDGSQFSAYYYNNPIGGYWKTNTQGSLTPYQYTDDKARAIITTTGFNCKDTTNYVSIKIKNAKAGFQIVNNQKCFESLTIIFTDTSKTYNTTIKNWRWDFGDGQFQNVTKGGQITHTYSSPGSYNVSLTTTDECNNTSYAFQQVQINGIKAIFSPSQTITGVDNQINFNNYSLNIGGYNPVYSWKFDDGGTSDIFSPGHTYLKPGTYNVTLLAEDKNAGCSSSASQSVKINCPEANFQVYQTDIGVNNSIAFYNYSNYTSNKTQYKWDFGDGSTSADYNSTHIYTTSGNYVITLSVWDPATSCDTSVYQKKLQVHCPVASFTSSATSIGLNAGVYFYNGTTFTSNQTQYSWDFGDGNNSPIFPHVFTKPGVYTVTLSAKDVSANCLTSDTLAITVKAFTFTQSYISNNGCAPLQAQFANITTNYNYVSWDFGDGFTAGNVNNPSHVYENPGTYIVKLSVYSSGGLNGTYIDSVIVKKPLVTTIEAGILDICRDQSVTLTSSETSLPSAIWDFGDGTLINLANSNASHKYATPGIYKPALLVKNTDGCTSSTKLTESINVRPDPIITITPAAPVLCKGNSIQLNAQVSKGINYIWTPDKSLDNAAIASPTASPLNSTTYTVKVTDDIGCSNTNSVSIFVAQPISVKVIADTPVCADKTLQMYAYGATTYKWINTVTGLSRTDIANPVLTPYASDVYTVAGYDAYNCFSDTVLLPVRVVPLPTVHASPKNTVVLAGSSVQLTATGSSDIVRWEWSPYNYLSCTNCPDPVSNVLDDITYTITVKNKEGCSVSDNVEIKTICEAERVAVPNAFTPNNDGRNDIFKISGIGMIKYLAIYDRWGIKVFERSNFIAGDRASCWDGNYRGSPLPAGTYVYIINMQCKGGNSFSQRGTVILIR